MKRACGRVDDEAEAGQMIQGVGATSSSGRIDGTRAHGTRQPGAAGAVATGEEAAPPSPAAALAASGPPVDGARIAELRQAIASGAYRADPQEIAARMIALDLPAKA
jgi:negative regulator of flagellin synthesis FlgM